MKKLGPSQLRNATAKESVIVLGQIFDLRGGGKVQILTLNCDLGGVQSSEDAVGKEVEAPNSDEQVSQAKNPVLPVVFGVWVGSSTY